MTNYQRIYNGERTVSLINGVGKTVQSHVKEWNWTTILHHTQKLNGLNVWPETKLLEGNIGSKVLNINLGSHFLDLTLKDIIKKLEYIKVKSYHIAKKPSRGEKITCGMGENIFKSCQIKG